MATPYMNLTLPVVGPLGTQGPDWATEINAALTLIDQHDHSSGLGKQITPAGININQTFQMNSNQISEIASLALDNLVSQPSSANLVYEYAGELYFNDANANQVQLTSGGTINVASVGTISGDYGGSNPANVSFSNLTETYLFTKSPGETGSIACGPVFIYQNTAGSFYAQIQQNVAQASNLDWTLPVDYPATKLPMKSSAGGVLELSQIVTSEIADAQVTAVKLATDSVETAKIKDLNVTTGKLADLSITNGKIGNQSITINKMGATNSVVSSSCGTFTITGTSVQVTNFSLSITTTGRPVLIIISSAATSTAPYVSGCINGIGSSNSPYFYLNRNGSGIATWGYVASAFDVIPLSYQYLDFVSAGTYIYSLNAKNFNFSGDLLLVNCKMTVMEI